MRKLFVPVLVLSAFAGCGPRGSEGDEHGVTGRVPIEVSVVSRETAVATVTAVGTVAPREDVVVSAEASARVLEVLVTVGDAVDAGDVLVRLDPELSEISVRQAEAQSLLADVELGDARVNFERAEKLLASGDIAEAEYEAAERRLKSARANSLAADAACLAALRQLKNTEVTSPISGVVAFVYVDPGFLVAVGSPVAQVIDDSVVRIDIGLSQDQVADVRAGESADVRVRALPGRVFHGRIEYVGRRADDRTRTYPARVIVRNEDGALRGGMAAEVTVAAHEFSDVILIDRDWVIERFGEPAVFVVPDTIAVLRKVTLGQVVGDRVIVAQGLAPGERVVSVGSEQLTDGAPVEVAGLLPQSPRR